MSGLDRWQSRLYGHRFLQGMKPRTLGGRRLSAAIGFLLIALLASASIFATGPTATPQARTEKAWPVSVVTIEPRPLHPTFNAYGRVEASHTAQIRTDLIARITEVAVKEGQWVEQNAVLLRLDAREIALRAAEREAQLAQHEAALQSVRTENEMLKTITAHHESMYRLATSKLERHEELMSQRLISQGLLDEVIGKANQATIAYHNHMRALADFPNLVAAQQANIARAQAQLAQARLDLDKTVIRAPFSGPVTHVFAAPGDHSNLGSALMEVADANSFEVRAQLNDAHSTRLRTEGAIPSGVHARVAAGAAGASELPASADLQLVRLSRQVRAGQTGIDAFFRFNVDRLRDLPDLGRVINLQVTLPAQPALVDLPAQSIYDNDRIYQVVDDRLNALTIERVGELQTSEGEYRVLVRSPDLTSGQRIITTQLPKAISGLRVAAAG
jgi:multidrug efflux pump subunit AcrA (membrane-fusion protein)